MNNKSNSGFEPGSLIKIKCSAYFTDCGTGLNHYFTPSSPLMMVVADSRTKHFCFPSNVSPSVGGGASIFLLHQGKIWEFWVGQNWLKNIKFYLEEVECNIP